MSLFKNLLPASPAVSKHQDLLRAIFRRVKASRSFSGESRRANMIKIILRQILSNQDPSPVSPRRVKAVNSSSDLSLRAIHGQRSEIRLWLEFQEKNERRQKSRKMSRGSENRRASAAGFGFASGCFVQMGTRKSDSLASGGSEFVARWSDSQKPSLFSTA